MANLKAAVIGAGKVGQHHARIYSSHPDTDLIAITNTTKEKAQKTAERFNCTGYSGTQQMLYSENPDLVSICTPPELHHTHTILALELSHALCEKPIALKLRDTETMQRKAVQTNKILAVNLQMVTTVPKYQKYFYNPETGQHIFTSFWSSKAQKDSQGKELDKSPTTLLHDLGSHPLSILTRFLPNGHITNIETEGQPNKLRVTFDYSANSQSSHPHTTFKSTITLKNCKKDEEIIRTFGIDNYEVSCQGKEDADGEFFYELEKTDDSQHKRPQIPDPLEQSISRFIQAVKTKETSCPTPPLVTTEEGIKNLEMVLAIESEIKTKQAAHRAPTH